MKKFRSYEISDPQFERDHLRFITAKSEYLNGRGDCTLFVPPLYETVPAGIPLVILLHGVHGSHWSWTYKIGIHKIALQLIHDKQIAPMAIVMPSDGLWGDGSGYLQHGEIKNFEKWIAEDVIELAKLGTSMIDASSPVFIAGLSMGGFGALRLAAKYPTLFKGAAGHSSVTCIDDLIRFVDGEEGLYYKINFEDEDLASLMTRNAHALPPFRFDCGESDPLIRSNRKLHQLLLANNVTHQYEEFTGEHTNDYWRDNIHRTLKFFSEIAQNQLKVEEPAGLL